MCLLFDEIDQLLSEPDICEDFLSALRSMKTMRCTNAKHTFALAGILGIGVVQIKKLILSTSKASPFNTSELFRLSQPSEKAVSQMFAIYGTDIGKDLTVFGHNIYGRTRGHLGLTSLLGKVLQEWVGITNDTNIGAWFAHLCNSRFAGQLSQFPPLRPFTRGSLRKLIFLEAPVILSTFCFIVLRMLLIRPLHLIVFAKSSTI